MHFQTPLMRNQFIPLYNQFSMPFVLPNQKVWILPKLCQALKASLQRFMSHQLDRIALNETKTQQTRKTPVNKTIVIQLDSSDEENLEQNLIIVDSSKQNETKILKCLSDIEQKTDLSKDQQEFSKQEQIDEQQPTSKTLRKIQTIRKQKSIKVSSKLRKHKFSQIQEHIDLTDAVMIKFSPFSVAEISRKKEGLLLRVVSDWDQTLKGRKQRREIRMLKN